METEEIAETRRSILVLAREHVDAKRRLDVLYRNRTINWETFRDWDMLHNLALADLWPSFEALDHA